MPHITSITEQKSNLKRQKAKKDRRFNVFIDEKYAFSVGEENLIKLNLKEGQAIRDDLIIKIKKTENLNKLLEKSINFLSFRPRSEKEVHDYIIKTISKDEKVKWAIAKKSDLPAHIITKLKKYGYINDMDFAKWWVQSRLTARPTGRKMIMFELIKKGVKKEFIEKLLPAKQKTELDLALKVLEKRKNKIDTQEPFDVKKKVYYLLRSRGFDFDTIDEAFAIYTKKR